MALWLLAVGPRVALAFPLWLLGAGAWVLVQRRPRVSAGVGVAILCGLAATALALRRALGSMASPLFEWPVASALVPSMGYYLALCAVLAATIVVFAATVGDRRFWPAPAERAIRYWAGASFTLYIMHVPLMVLIAAAWPAMIGSPARAGVALAMTVGIILILAELGERRKAAYARAFSAAFRIFTIGKRKTANAID
jgi:peptidoglycan/LPS O-acetylase OafA/YrhL